MNREQPAIQAKRWQCAQCDETISVNFAKCWRCGTTIDGVRDPEFATADEFMPSIEDGSGPFRFSNLFWANFVVSSLLLAFAAANQLADAWFYFGYMLLAVAAGIYVCCWGYPAVVRQFQRVHRAGLVRDRLESQ